MSGPDYNADKELGKGQVVWTVQNTRKGLPVKEIETSKGTLKLDPKGRCLITEPSLANEIRQEHRTDLDVSRVFRNHPSDRGHRYHFGQMPALPWAKYDQFGRRIYDEQPSPFLPTPAGATPPGAEGAETKEDEER